VKLLRQLWDILNPRDRTRLVAVFAATIVGSVVEATALGLVVPFIGVLADPASLTQGRWPAVISWLPAMSTAQTVLVLAGLLFAMFVIKNSYLTLLIHHQFRFVYRTQAAVSRRLLSAYLHAPWTFHIQRNSSELLRDVNVEVPIVFGSILNPLMVLTTELLVTVAIVVLLVVVDPWSSILCLLLLGGTSGLFYMNIRRKMNRLGREQLQVRADMIKSVTQGLAAVKETKVLGREGHFAGVYAEASGKYASSNTYLATMSQLPRFFLETAVIGGILAILLVMSWRGRDSGDALGVLALFAVAAFRLMPAMNRIVSCVSNIRYHQSALETVHAGLAAFGDATDERRAGPRSGPAKEGEAVAAANPPFEERLELRHLRYRYPSAEADALSDVDVVIPKGAAVGITGPSGAGKTTLVDVIVGLLEPTHGRVVVDGRESTDLQAWRRRIGYVPQQVYLLDDSVRRNVAFGLRDDEIDDGRVWEALRAAQLEALVRGLPDGLGAGVGERGVRFSGGERQRLGIARALYHDPDVLVLDEITASLDVETEREVTRAIRSLKGTKTLIIITHRLSTIDHCDVVYELAAGRLVATRAPVSPSVQ
jgi:ABC-type multidrug transport system fused ATPase/permease subunit